MQVSIATVLHMLHINLVPFATAGGVGGIVLGFASQSVLANIVAGCNLLITRPLVVGDRVTLAGEPCCTLCCCLITKSFWYRVLMSQAPLKCTTAACVAEHKFVCRWSQCHRCVQPAGQWAAAALADCRQTVTAVSAARCCRAGRLHAHHHQARQTSCTPALRLPHF